MADTIKEDKDGEYARFIAPGSISKHVDEMGHLTKAMIDDLKEIKYEELINLEEKIKNARLPTEDIFGIKRRFCKICEHGCAGYEPNSLMVPMPGEFPTFCKACKCPAHFHQVCIDPSDIVFPTELKETIQNHNIATKDLNFNCVMLAFQIRSENMQTQNNNELMTILREEGLEVISIERRELEIEEAIYLKSKMIGQTENMILTSLGMQHHNNKSHGKMNEIRKDGRYGSAFISKSGAADPFYINQTANVKEANLIKTVTRFAGQHPKEHLEHIPGLKIIKSSTGFQQDANQQPSLTEHKIEILDTINQRVPLNQVPQPSIPRTSTVQTQKDQDFEEQLSLVKRETIVQSKKQKVYKVRTYTKTLPQNKVNISKTHFYKLSPEEEEAVLVQQINKDPLMQELITKEVLLLAVGSATFQNLESKIKNQVMQKIQIFLPPDEMPLLYISETRTQSLEDCLIFFPSLFKLTKSIIVSEPVSTANIPGLESTPGLDVTTDISITLRGGTAGRGGDAKNPDLMNKLNDLYDSIDRSNPQGEENQGDIHGHEFHQFYRNRGTLKIKTSQKLKSLLQKRDQLKQTSQGSSNGFGGEDSNWADRVKDREKKVRKQQKLLSQNNKILYNFGVLHDFFNYSAMTIQESIMDIDISNPQKTLQKENAFYELRENAFGNDLNKKPRSNVFAIAKVGLPNLILPSSLEIKFTNYNAYSAYLHLCDSFFPTLSTSEHTVLVLRPMIVKNGLNDFLVQILKINDFVILKRKVRMLTKSEVAFLSEKEGVTDDKCDTYYNIMMDGECEIVALSKIGAVKDLKTIVDGSAPLGRRRIAQLDEEVSAVRTNVDAVNSMFEITPFTSMSEFIDLEDFIVSHSKLEKYKKLQKKNQTKEYMSRINEQLYFQKLESIRKELNTFSRFFNIVAHAPSEAKQGQEEMCVLMPEVAIVEEVILILNPIYGAYFEAAEKLLFRMGFKTLNHKILTLDDQTVNSLFKDTSTAQNDSIDSQSSQTVQKIVKYLSNSQVYVWHLTKISADREIRQLFGEAQIELEDIISMRVRQTPFKLQHFPFLFMFMDTPYKFEVIFKQLWGEQLAMLTGQQLIDNLNQNDRKAALELALQSTLGDKIKELAYDRFGNLLDESKLADAGLSVHIRVPQLFQIYGNSSGSTAVHNLVESEFHGLFEIRFSRLPHQGDIHSLAFEPAKINMEKLKLRYFTKFEALNFYYNEVNKHFYNICPAFYRFKICPLVPEGQQGANIINRVYEVEEYMGVPFINDIASMHQSHIQMLKNQSLYTPSMLGKSLQQIVSESDQKSLPAYIWGSKIAKMVMKLQQIKGAKQVKGAGKIIFENQSLRGEVKDPQEYYKFDRARYYKYLEDFKKGWNYFLSVLECDLIETKLRRILDSQTFKESRKAANLFLMPDKLTEINLRISEKVQLLVEDALEQDNNEKFFKHLKTTTLEPTQEEEAVNFVQSIMHTLYIENVKVNQQERRFQDNNEGKGFRVEDTDQMKAEEEKRKKYSIYKDCAIVGVEVARRPKYQMFASIYYLINFILRKVDRKTELFESLDRQYADTQSKPYLKSAEAYYDSILDTLLTSLTDNYGRDEINYALDMINPDASTNDGKNPLEASEFERMVKEKQELEACLKESIQHRAEDELRALRSRMSFEELLKSIQDTDPKEEEQKQQLALRKFVETQGYNDQHGEGFMSVLKETQSYLGPYSIKMAHDYLKNLETSRKAQEKISFVKMEYFLYAVTQAHNLVTELRQMEGRYNDLQDELEQAQLSLNSMGIMPKQAEIGYFKSKSEATLYQKRHELLEGLTFKIEKLRYQISLKESELVMIFRELMSWDYSVPDYYFDQNLMLDKKKQEQLKETYLLPTRTFWRPVYFDDYKEPDILKQQYARRFRDHQEAVPKELQQIIDQNFTEEEKQQLKPRRGVLISYLRPYDAKEKNDFLKFDKFYSKGEYNEHQELDKIKTKINSKLSKSTYDFSSRFHDPTL